MGGDQLQLQVELGAGCRALLTSVAAQKVYGSVRRSRRHPQGSWAAQRLEVGQAAGSDLEWLPQELVLYADALYEQTLQVELAEGASFLGMEVVRLGRSAAGESLGEGCWRSRTEAPCASLRSTSRAAATSKPAAATLASKTSASSTHSARPW